MYSKSKYKRKTDPTPVNQEQEGKYELKMPKRRNELLDNIQKVQ